MSSINELDRAVIGDIVEAAIRRTLNGDLRRLEQAVNTQTHENRQTREQVTRLAQYVEERSDRWDEAADTSERIRGFVRVAASRGGKVAAVVLAGLIGFDAFTRLFFG